MTLEPESRYRPAERVSEDELVEIRIRPDGSILFHGTSEEFLEIAAGICPNDPWLRERMKVMGDTRNQNRADELHATTLNREETSHDPA